MSEVEKLIEAANQGSVEDVKAVLANHPELINERDDSGATAMHCAAFDGHRGVVELLMKHGADINARDGKFGATPAGWAIEYLREMGGFLGIELDDFAYAIRKGDVEWTARFLKRFPKLRVAADQNGILFSVLAAQSGNPEIARLFEVET